MEWYGLDSCLRIGTNGHDNEISISVKCWEILEQLIYWRLLKKGSAYGVSYNMFLKLFLSLRVIRESRGCRKLQYRLN
jgi:hypothetical protein